MKNVKALMVIGTILAASTWMIADAKAQDAAPVAVADEAAPAEVAPAEPAAPAFSQEQLDQMLAPIALYPDSLLMQLMMSATYPLELVTADRWRKKNPSLQGDALDKAVEPEDWDPSVKAMTLFPDLLSRMSDNLDWTQDLGDAFLGQQAQVLDTIQALRKQAYDAGNLQSGEQQKVIVEKETQVIQIQPAQPETVYVPQYNSAAAYGTPPPATSYYPTVNTYSGTQMLMTGALSFGAGLLIGNLIWDDDSDCDWDDHHVYGGYGGRGNNNDINIDVDGDVNIGNGRRPGVGGGNRQPWQHDATHRRGVNYRDTKTQKTFANKATARPALDRNAATGYGRGGIGSAGGGRAPSVGKANIPAAKLPSGAGNKGIGGSGPKAPIATKKPAPAAVAQKRPSSGIGSAGGNRPTAVGGLGGGSATRAASARGASSRGVSAGGGGKGGGGGGAKLGGGGGLKGGGGGKRK